MILLAIDPGRDTGWAQFLDGTLIACGLTHPDQYRDVFPRIVANKAIIERPQIYPGARNGDDIVTLSARMGAIQALLDCECEEISPARWKHQTPKEVHNRRVLAKLTDPEKAIMPRNHNVIDAVGLGLWKLGRIL